MVVVALPLVRFGFLFSRSQPHPKNASAASSSMVIRVHGLVDCPVLPSIELSVSERHRKTRMLLLRVQRLLLLGLLQQRQCAA